MDDKPDRPFFEGKDLMQAPEGAQFPAPWEDAEPDKGPIFRVTPLMRWTQRHKDMGHGYGRSVPVLQQAWWCKKDLSLLWRDVP